MRALRPVLVLALATSTAFVSAAADRSGKLADDPRVADAAAAWARWVEYQLQLDQVPGASVALVHDQEVLYSAGFGLADPDRAVAATPGTLYSICSISKLFTSIAALQLRDAGRLDLDAPVTTYLEWVDDLKDVHPGDEAWTLRRILTHSSGLPREADSPYWVGPDFDFPTREEVRRLITHQVSLYPSGRYFQYSNLGLTLAGEVVAAVTGRPWEEVVRAEILAPLGMESTFTSVPEAHATGRLAVGYSERRGGEPRERLPLFDVEGIAPAAGMASSAEDLARFATWQLGLYSEGAESDVLRPATLREMQRVHWVDPDWETTWGLGFAVWRHDERTFAGHSGGCPGYYTAFRVVPADRLGVVVLSNAIGTDVGRYAAQAVALLAPAVAEAEEDPDAAPERDPSFERYVGSYDTVWGRLAVVTWKDALAVVDLHADEPAEDLERLEHVEGHTFRRVRKDDESPGETWVFQVDDEGRVLSVTVHSVPWRRVR